MHLDTNFNLSICTFYVYANSEYIAQCLWWDLVPQTFVFSFIRGLLQRDIQIPRLTKLHYECCFA